MALCISMALFPDPCRGDRGGSALGLGVALGNSSSSGQGICPSLLKEKHPRCVSLVLENTPLSSKQPELSQDKQNVITYRHWRGHLSPFAIKLVPSKHPQRFGGRGM